MPLLERLGLEAKKSHATSVALIFFLSIASTIAYSVGGDIAFDKALGYIPAGIVGAVIGAFVLKKISNDLLRRIFGIIILASSVRIMLL